MSRPPLRAAVVGTARVGSFFDDLLTATPELLPSSQASCYATHPRTLLVAGCDLDPAKLETFGRRWGVGALYTDFRELLARERPDVVSVTSSWGHTKDEILPDLACSGVKGIYSEIPIATSMAKANEIIREVERHGVKFASAYPRRWNPRYRAIKRLVDAGEIGEIISITTVGAGNLLHDTSHDFDAMSYWAGDPEPAWAVGRVEPEPLDKEGKPIQDAKGSGYVEHKNGVRFFVEGLSFPGSSTYVISGTTGRTITINDCRDVDLWRHPPLASDRWMSHERQPRPEFVRSTHYLALSELIEAIDKDREPSNNARVAARNMEYRLAIHASHRQGGWRVTFPLADQQLAIDAW
jgi:predicted dehydrogenase